MCFLEKATGLQSPGMNQNASHDKTCVSTAKFMWGNKAGARHQSRGVGVKGLIQYAASSCVSALARRGDLCAQFSRTPNEAGAFRRVQ